MANNDSDIVGAEENGYEDIKNTHKMNRSILGTD